MYLHVRVCTGTYRKRPSGCLTGGVPTRPLYLKFHAVLDLMLLSLQKEWGGESEHECAAKMGRLATLISGKQDLW
jgi:hypothetical protein